MPVGIIAWFIGQRILPGDVTDPHAYRQDGWSLFAFIMVSLFAGALWAKRLVCPTADSRLVCGCHRGDVVFVRLELRVADPILALKLFTNKRFSISILYFLIFVANFFFNVISPFYLKMLDWPPTTRIRTDDVPHRAGHRRAHCRGRLDKIGPELLTFIAGPAFHQSGRLHAGGFKRRCGFIPSA